MSTTRLDALAPTPARQVSTPWGEFTATCDHPRRIRFHAGTDGTPLLAVGDHNYVCTVIAYRDVHGDPTRRQRIALPDDWYALAVDASLALSHTNGVAALDDHQAVFVSEVLPVLGAWLETAEAARLLGEGRAHWRRRCDEWATSTETDLTRALARVRAIRDRIIAGELPADDDERYLRYARVHPR